MLTRRFPAALLFVALAFGLLQAAACTAQTAAKIENFYGHYVGQGIAKDRESVVFDHALRVLDTTIAPAPDGAFSVKWQTVVRDSESKDPKSTSQVLVFKPTDRPGIFGAIDNRDPIAGGTYAWAEIEGRSLIVNVFSVQANGNGYWAIYDRKLTADGIDLTFRRVEGTGTTRIVHGKLKKAKAQ